MSTLTQDHFKPLSLIVFFFTPTWFFFFSKQDHATVGAFSPSPGPGPWSLLQIDSTTVSPSLFVGLRPIDTQTQKTVPSIEPLPAYGAIDVLVFPSVQTVFFSGEGRAPSHCQ